ncbi:hypothetical protein OG746_26935 [Streptomyces sp. NBC_01016]|uniref:hypothetical protein n=1 Tax=Streptomyces sp. NBC_01016 TaxID=2903720 RepID=UPI00224EB00E|nr:hypothetical protein [Streptomyces sp. NBC_01016]MCX4827133.1 hypothetical protein [Streptomyces sp. NBC_01016]MCX4832378.1 hypothetical protein [Streptomyces sp. NBC_01016]
MTGPEHYVEAERLVAEAAVDGAEGTRFVRPENLAAAQVHATLALAAATAMGAPMDGHGDSGLPPLDCEEWYRVAGVKPRKGGDA